jgi:signal transduction histidine kinase
LYISKRIVELHNGQIGVTSEGIGKGTTFFFTIPIATQKDVEVYHAQPKNPQDVHVGLEHVKI